MLDTYLIYNRVIGLQVSSQVVDILKCLSHKLDPVPISSQW